MAAESALQETGFGAEHLTAVDVDLELLQIEDLFDRHVYQPR